MKRYLLLAVLAFLLVACHKVPIGYLETENAVYVPDSLVIRLEPDPLKDYVRMLYKADWVSTKIQGVLGTAPIIYTIIDVRAEDGGDAEAMKAVCTINGSGTFDIPYEHQVPVGRYIMSIEIRNDGYAYEFRDAFTIIVE